MKSRLHARLPVCAGKLRPANAIRQHPCVRTQYEGRHHVLGFTAIQARILWEQHRIIRFDTLTAQAEYTVMAVFRGEAEDLFAYYQCTDAETPQEFAAYGTPVRTPPLYETGVTAAYGDKLITLSTCDDSGKTAGWSLWQSV